MAKGELTPTRIVTEVCGKDLLDPRKRSETALRFVFGLQEGGVSGGLLSPGSCLLSFTWAGPIDLALSYYWPLGQ
jgi:hypothetical protein